MVIGWKLKQFWLNNMRRKFINYFGAVVFAAGVGVALIWVVVFSPELILAWLDPRIIGNSVYENLAVPLFKLRAIEPTITLTFVGDIMLDRGVANSYKRNGGLAWLLDGIKPLGEADILFGNLEGPISDRGRKVGSKYSFRMATSSALALAQAGFDVLSVANNHAGDWSLPAFSDTLAHLEHNDIVPVGGGVTYNQAKQVKVITIRNTRIGFLAFSDVGPQWLKAGVDTPGILLVNDPDFKQIIQTAAAEVEALIVSFHWGEEYKTLANERQRVLATQAITAGAKLVIGHHPHVAEPVEWLGEGLVAYSLGNFIFDQDFSAETMEGLVLTVNLTPDGQIKNYLTNSVKLSSEFKPRLELPKNYE